MRDIKEAVDPGAQAAPTDGPITIKKYANRRLYNTSTSSYVTLEHLADMVRTGQDFVVYDAKTGEDITRSVLAQIIFELESKGQNLMPIRFLRQLIRLYGDSMQSLVPGYLEMSIEQFTRHQEGFRKHFASAFGGGTSALKEIEEQVRSNMAIFERTMRMFTPFGAAMLRPSETDAEAAAKAPRPGQATDEIDDLKEKLDAIQRQLDQLTKKG